MNTVLYNGTHKFLNILPEINQDEIFNCPQFHAMSLSEIYNSGKCPEFLKTTLNHFPWNDKKNLIQIKTQDFRHESKERFLGDSAHVDMDVSAIDGKYRVAKNLFDWRLMLCSFGNIAETDFMIPEMNMVSLDDRSTSYVNFFSSLSPKSIFHRPLPNQLVEYTSRDIHRLSPIRRLGGYRLIIVAIESDEIEAGGIILPSLKQRMIPS